ncbi:MAG: lamin tail domain-containing protein [Anaerolineales bacterium]|nr:lamin tail domain-containing protein [Anaerolineales bacterium]MCX7609169.1 lamin tail domain-containing protein [Anaerolineales bacterium]MDW8227603.1 lamin tail domain-containing protein [Anaerolineales bacterium]
MTRRLVLYLLLNSLLSAAVAGMMLFLYDRFVRPDCPSNAGVGTSVAIIGVAGIGNLDTEVLTLRNLGDESVTLTGWTLRTTQNDLYTFPSLTLYPGGSVNLHTASGEDTITDLYWNLTRPAWRSGDQVVLYDTQGLARAFYRIP